MEDYFIKKGDVDFYEVEVVKIYDTNTVIVDIHFVDTILKSRRFKLYGVKCCSWRSSKKEEKASADLAMKELKTNLLPKRKYIAHLGAKGIQIFIGEKTINEILINKGLGYYHLVKDLF